MLAMGRVLMLHPTIMVLDEPTSGLSPELSRKLLHEYIRGPAASGIAVSLVEQNAQSALEMADWAHVLVSRRTQMEGAASDFLKDNDFGAVFLGAGLTESES